MVFPIVLADIPKFGAFSYRMVQQSIFIDMKGVLYASKWQQKKNGHDPYKNGTFFVSNTISPTATKMSNRMLLKTCLIRTN